MGTARYMSPSRPATGGRRTDRHLEFGCSDYELAAGRARLQDQHRVMSSLRSEREPQPHSLHEDIIADTARVRSNCDQGTRERSEDRYQTAKDLAIDLRCLKQRRRWMLRLKGPSRR